MYPVFHVSALEPYYKQPKSLVPLPKEDERVIHILNSSNYKGNYQYLVSYQNYKQEWVDANVIDENPHYADLLRDYQDFSFQQFCANVVSHK